MKVKHGTVWRKIIVSFIFMEQVISTWRESFRVITKWPWAHCKRLRRGSAEPSSYTVSDGGKHYFLQYSHSHLCSGKDLTNSTSWYQAPLYNQIATPMSEFPKKNRDEQNPNKSQHCDWDFSFNMRRNILIVYFPKYFPATSPNHTKVCSHL